MYMLPRVSIRCENLVSGYYIFYSQQFHFVLLLKREIITKPLPSTQKMNISRYTEWYDQPANDPYKGNYANLFRSFDPLVTPIDATGKDLLASIATGLAPKTAFVMGFRGSIS
jgi:hypothetical protein